jgi:ABC-type transport system involved in multi-copper enzyme maturation permease subunit
MAAAIIGSSLFIFVILIFKNVAYGLGSDLEKGIIQTLFSYPLKRRSILTAKLLSALGVSLLLFLGIQLSALCILAPDIVASHLGTILLTYVASLSFPLFLTGIILLVTFVIKRGGLALILGIVLYFALAIVSSIAMFVAVATKSPLILKILSVFSPSTALALYYGQTDVTSIFGNIWIPTFSEVLISIGASYVIVAFTFFLGYYYFCRRLSP